MSPLVVLGTGGHATVVVDLARAMGRPVLGCLGPESPASDASFCTYLGGDEVLDTLDRDVTEVAIGVGSLGDVSLRKRLFEAATRRGFRVPALVHPRAIVAESAEMGAGAQVMPGAVLQALVRLGANVIINTGAIIEHHVQICDHVHVGPGAVVCGGCCVGASSHVGANAAIIQGISVGEGSMIGAGAVVVRDVPAGAIVKGNPAR